MQLNVLCFSLVEPLVGAAVPSVSLWLSLSEWLFVYVAKYLEPCGVK